MDLNLSSRVTVGSRLLLRFQPTQNDGSAFTVSAATVVFYLRDPSGNITTFSSPTWNAGASEWQQRLGLTDLDETSSTSAAGVITDWAVGVKTTESPVNAPSEWIPFRVYRAAGT